MSSEPALKTSRLSFGASVSRSSTYKTNESKGPEIVGEPRLRLEANYQKDPFKCLVQEAVVRR
jgi:hypothetical protein